MGTDKLAAKAAEVHGFCFSRVHWFFCGLECDARVAFATDECDQRSVICDHCWRANCGWSSRYGLFESHGLCCCDFGLGQYFRWLHCYQSNVGDV